MAIQLNAKGQPHVSCPTCGRLHIIRRNKGYTGKLITRHRCTHCKTSWPATPEEAEQIAQIYKEHHENLRSKGVRKPPGRKPKENKEDKKSHWTDRVFGELG